MSGPQVLHPLLLDLDPGEWRIILETKQSPGILDVHVAASAGPSPSTAEG